MRECKQTLGRMAASLVVVLIAATLVGCATTTQRSAGQVMDDTGIALSVKARLVAEKVAYLTRVNVKVLNAVVYLEGTVDTAEERQRIEELARRADGIRRIVNEIAVKSPARVRASSTPAPG